MERRPVTVAIAVGVVIGFAEAAPLFQLPLFFKAVLGYGALGATLATLPFIAALVVAGPIAGVLITRFGPRTLVAAGLAAVGLGNLVAALVLGPQVPYVSLILPFVLIGAGFVVGTTVRTAIIFASVSRGLPATAAALNEASVLVGSRIGLVGLTVITTRLALDAYASSLGSIDPGQRDAAVAAFRRSARRHRDAGDRRDRPDARPGRHRPLCIRLHRGASGEPRPDGPAGARRSADRLDRARPARSADHRLGPP